MDSDKIIKGTALEAAVAAVGMETLRQSSISMETTAAGEFYVIEHNGQELGRGEDANGAYINIATRLGFTVMHSEGGLMQVWLPEEAASE